MESLSQESSMDSSNPEEVWAEVQRLRSQNAQISSDLDECRDQLFSLLQKENDIPEHEIKSIFNLLTKGIDSWIDDVSEDEHFDFKAQYQGILQSSNRVSYFDDLMLPSDIGWQTKLGKEGTCHYAILSLVISRWLEYDVLMYNSRGSWPIYPFGLTPAQKETFHDVRHAMKGKAEDREADSHRFATWRKDTITALAETADFKSQQEQHIEEARKYLLGKLSLWLSSRVIDEHKSSLNQKVIEPALKLQKVFSSSRKQYGLDLPKVIPPSLQTTTENFTFSEISTLRTVLSPKDIQGYITRLYPGIRRQGASDENNVTIAKPVLLVTQIPELVYSAPARTGRLEKVGSDLGRHDQRRHERGSDAPKSRRFPRRNSPQKSSSSKATSQEIKTERLKSGELWKVGWEVMRSGTLPNARASPTTSPTPQPEQINRTARTQTYLPEVHGHWPRDDIGAASESRHQREDSATNLSYDGSVGSQGRVTIDSSQGQQTYDLYEDGTLRPYQQIEPWSYTQ